MPDHNLNKQLDKLHKNLNILREREAKYADNAPLDLLNLISDHQEAIRLVEQARAGQISDQKLAEQLTPLNLSVGGNVQNILQIIPRPYLIIALSLVAVMAGVLFLNTSWGEVTFGPAPTAIPTPTPFTTPAQAEELLILVAEFDSAGEKVIKAHEDIYDKLQEEKTRLQLNNVRVEFAPKITQDWQIKDWQRLYRPIFVIWGGTDDVRTIIRFSITTADNDNLARVPTAKILLDKEDFDLIISYELPEQMAFFAKFIIGQIYFRDNKLQEAHKLFDAALQAYPATIPAETLANTYFYQGLTSQKMNNLEPALTSYQHTIERDPTFYQAYYNRGVVYVDLGQSDQAIDDFSQVIALKPDLAWAYFNRAALLFQQKNFQPALQDYTQGLDLNPTDANVWVARGNVYQSSGDFTRALADYNHAIELASDLGMAYLRRGKLEQKTGALDKALADFQQATTLFDPEQERDWYIQAQESLAWLAYNRGEYQKAITANQAALKAGAQITPGQPSFSRLLIIRYNLALALLAVGQTPQAKTEYDTALSLTADAKIVDAAIADVEALRRSQPDNADLVELLDYLRIRQVQPTPPP